MRATSKSTRIIVIMAVMALVSTLLIVGIVNAQTPVIEESSAAVVVSAPSPQDAVEELTAVGDVSMNSATGVVRFASFPQGLDRFIVATSGKVAAEAQADAFLAEYGAAFGIRDASAQLSLVNTAVDQYGFTHVNYVQVHDGVNVYASTMRVHFNVDGKLTAVNGTFIPKITGDSAHKLSAEQAANIAIAEVARQQASGLVAQFAASNAVAVNNNLYYYHTGLLQSKTGNTVLVYEVEVSNSADIREFVFVDANSGAIVEQITGIMEGAGSDREISETSLANVVWDESNGDPDPITPGWAGGTVQQVTDWQNEIDGSLETYNVIDNLTGGTYSSYDGAEATMRTVNNDPGISCPNANWNGISTNYCTGVTGDDTVAHEWGHAYTEYTHNLVYAWQSGALNESYSDIWGEIIDLVNGRGTDSPGGLRSDGGCSVYGQGSNDDNSYRWLSGEDDPAFGGAIRDMWTPTCYGDPGKVSDAQYHCAASDGGGVHTNSGVPNHAFALLVDGGTYNSQTITGIGLDKAAHIYWRTQSVYQSAASDFVDHASALTASCSDLTGIATLTGLSATGTPGAIIPAITAGDCAELTKVIAAVEFNTPPTQCGFTPAFETAPALCAGQGTGVVTSIYTQTWEIDMDGWTTGTHDIANAASFTNPDWVIRGSLPGGRGGNAMYVEDSINRGACTPADTVAGALNLDTPVFVVPAGITVTRVAIDHLVSTESGWDGGNVKINVNGGGWVVLPDSAFAVNGYFDPGAINGGGNDNPLAGEEGFTGGGEGSLSSGWGQSQLDLSPYVGPGDSYQLRFDMGLDGCNGVDGWYIDEFEVYACEADVNTPDIVFNVDESSMSSIQATNSQVTQTMTIRNDGAVDDLDWTVEEAPSALYGSSPLFMPALQANMGSRDGNRADTMPPIVYTSQGDLTEGFDDVTNLPGWATDNNSDVTGTTDWFQGNSAAVFPAHAGDPDAYMGVNFNSTAGTQISNWLMTPELNFTSTSLFSFWTRTAAGSTWPDRLQIRVSTAGASVDVGTSVADVGDFTDLEVDINETLSAGGYPEVWTQYTINLSAYAGQSGRVAFHYYIPVSAGPTGSNSNYVGIDTVEFIESATGCSVPADITWVSVNPTSGTIAPMNSAAVDVVYDSTGMADGVYTGILCVASNDPLTPLIEVPVSMTVGSVKIYLPAIMK